MKSFQFCAFRCLSFMILVVALPSSACAKTRYESFLSNGQQVIFLYPTKLQSDTKAYQFEYDFTHQAATDSVTLNFFVTSPSQEAVKSLSIIGDGDTIRPKYYRQIFCEYQKGKYVYRIQTSFSYPSFKKIMTTTATSPQFVVALSDKKILFSYKTTAWRKERDQFNVLLNLLD